MPRTRGATMLQADPEKFLIAIGNAGMDLYELSKESGVGYSTICMMRRGLYMKPWKLGKVCKVLEVKVEDIVRYRGGESDAGTTSN